ncbi:MAG: dienelactone hydrolase family protein [Chloroflexi bacterium]|nr:dienelactone hydrolase family protein [Chloroflexota bacterium]
MSEISSFSIEEMVACNIGHRIDRREFLRGMLLAAGAVTAGPLLSLPGCTAAQPTPTATPTSAPKPTTTPPTPAPKPAASKSVSPLSVPEGDPSVETAAITLPNEDATIIGYRAKPKGDGPFPTLLICHENRGLTDHIKDVARRFAKQGYVGLALDMLSREGGSDKIQDQSQIPNMFSNIPQERHVSDFQAGFRYLLTQPFVDKSRIGMIGYCFGGGVTWRAVTKIRELKAAVAYYGPAPAIEDVPNIQATVFGVYAENDSRINVGREPLEAALKQHNKSYQMKVYPGVAHAFFNDTGNNYNEAQALEAWKDTQEFLTKYLKS